MLLKSPNLEVNIVDLRFRKPPKREKTKQKIVNVRFECPLTFELAGDIADGLQSAVYIRADRTVSDVADLSFDLTDKLYVIDIRAHKDIKTAKRIGNVGVRAGAAYKTDTGEWMVAMTLTFTLDDQKDALEFLRYLYGSCCLSFLSEQQPNLEEVEPAPAGDKVADVDQGGNVTKIRKKGDKPDTPVQTH